MNFIFSIIGIILFSCIVTVNCENVLHKAWKIGLDKKESLATTTPDSIVCPSDVKECPDGSFVSRNYKNNCEFFQCTGSVCTSDVKQCPEGSYVSRNHKNNCEFFDCPEMYVDCEQPPVIDNGEVSVNIVDGHMVAFYSCYTGSVLIGTSDQLHCESNGKWKGTVPMCYDVDSWKNNISQDWFPGDDDFMNCTSDKLVHAAYNISIDHILMEGMSEARSCIPLIEFIYQLTHIIPHHNIHMFSTVLLDMLGSGAINNVVTKYDANQVKEHFSELLHSITEPVMEAVGGFHKLLAVHVQYLHVPYVENEVWNIFRDSIASGEFQDIPATKIVSELANINYGTFVGVEGSLMQGEMSYDCEAIVKAIGPDLKIILKSLYSSFTPDKIHKTVISVLEKKVRPDILEIVLSDIVDKVLYLLEPFHLLETVYYHSELPSVTSLVASKHIVTRYCFEYTIDSIQRYMKVHSNINEALKAISMYGLHKHSSVEYLHTDAIVHLLHEHTALGTGSGCINDRRLLDVFVGVYKLNRIGSEEKTQELLNDLMMTLKEEYPSLNAALKSKIYSTFHKQVSEYWNLFPTDDSAVAELIPFQFLRLFSEYKPTSMYEFLYALFDVLYISEHKDSRECALDFDEMLQILSSNVSMWTEDNSTVSTILDNVLRTCVHTSESSHCIKLDDNLFSMKKSHLENSIHRLSNDMKHTVLWRLEFDRIGIRSYIIESLATILDDHIRMRIRALDYLPLFDNADSNLKFVMRQI